jgi:serine/threonine protein kinase
MLLNGTQLGRYRIVRLIRRGGMSEVYLAEDTRISRQIAIKTIQNETSLYPDESTKQEASRLFLREMSIVSNLYHPHILQLYDFGEEVVDGVELAYMVMPFHAEGSLVDWLRLRGKRELLAVEDVVGLILQAGDALQYAHERQIMHLDVKPSNFLVRARKEKPEQPDLFLADFGIARVAATSKDSSTMRGTLEYMAPEQWDGHPVAASDQYALAIMTYELLTGSVPFRGNLSQIMFKHFREIPQPPSKLNPRVPHTINTVILRALAKKPEERFASVSEFVQALQQALQVSNEIRASLALSEEEAQVGTNRLLTLPGGRKITVTIPAGTRDGQLMRFTTEGKLSHADDPAGILLLTIIVKPREETVAARDVEYDKKTERGISIAPLDGPVPDKVPADLEPTVLPSSSGGQDSIGQAVHRAEGVVLPPTARKQSRNAVLTLALALIATCLVIASIVSFGSYLNTQNTIKRIYATATVSAGNTVTAQDYADATNNAVVGATSTYVAASPYPAYLPGIGTLALYDALKQPDNWPENSGSGYGCKFTGGAYHISEIISDEEYHCYSSNIYSNLAFQVQMTILHGDCGGITFREDSSGANFYEFDVCEDQTYTLSVYHNNNPATILRQSSNNQINLGRNVSNTVVVVAQGSAISLYVNYVKIDSIKDSALSSGAVGLVALESMSPTEVAYRDAKVWTF